MRPQPVEVGAQPDDVQPRSGEGSVGDLQFLPSGRDGFLARRTDRQQLLIALCLRLRIILSCLGFAQRRFRPPCRRCLRLDAVVEVDRVHFAEHLSRLDQVAHVHVEALDASGGGRADLVRVPRLHRADAEQSRRDRPFINGGDRHRHRCQRPRAENDIDKEQQQGSDNRQQGQRALLQGKFRHDRLLIPSR